MSQPIFFFFLIYIFTTFYLSIGNQATTVEILHRPPPSTIPAFPEQSDVSGCPLDLPEELFHGIKSACTSKTNRHSDEIHRSRCCPVLAAWLYSAYSKTGLRTAAKTVNETVSYDMPLLPDDSETCVDKLEKALGNRGIELGKPNETCDVVYCYCGIRLHPFSCPEAFSVNSRGKLVGGDAVKKLESDCFNGGVAGCSNCLKTLQLLNGDKGRRRNRTSKIHNQDCQLMGLSWLLNKDRASYISTVSAVLRALMMNADEALDPTFCSLNKDGMPLAVDSLQINDQSSSTILAVHHLLSPIAFLLFINILWLLHW